MKSPRISSTQVDWDAAVRELRVDRGAQAGRCAGGDGASSIAPPASASPTSRQARCRCCCPSTPRPSCASGQLRPIRQTLQPGAQCSGGLPLRLQCGDALLSRPRRLRRRGHGARAGDARIGIGYSDPIYIHIGGSALVYELDEPVGMIGWPVHAARGHSRHPPHVSRKLRALHLRALRRALRRCDRMLRQRLARSQDVVPRCRQGRGALPQGTAPRRRHAAQPAGRGRRRHDRSAAGTVRRSSPITAPATSFRAPASGAKAAWPTTPSIPGSVFRLPTHRLSPIPSPS